MKRTIKITRVDLNEVAPPDLLEQLQSLFGQLDVQRRESLKALRTAQIAAASHLAAQAQEQMLMAKFFSLAAEADGQIAVEAGCMPPFTNSNGHLIVQIPFTEREQRVLIQKAHQEMMSNNPANPEDDSIMFSDGDDDEK